MKALAPLSLVVSFDSCWRSVEICSKMVGSGLQEINNKKNVVAQEKIENQS